MSILVEDRWARPTWHGATLIASAAITKRIVRHIRCERNFDTIRPLAGENLAPESIAGSDGEYLIKRPLGVKTELARRRPPDFGLTCDDAPYYSRGEMADIDFGANRAFAGVEIRLDRVERGVARIACRRGSRSRFGDPSHGWNATSPTCSARTKTRCTIDRHVPVGVAVSSEQSLRR